MAFDTQPSTSSSNVDWKGLNEHIVEVAKTQDKKRSLVGIISGVVEVGEQNLEDAEMEFNGNAEAEAAEIAKNSNTYFKDGINIKTKKPVRLKCWPQKPQKCVAITVDFPQIVVDKGQFFGESKPLPLRMLLNGEFTNNGVTKLGRMYPITWEKLTDGTFTLKRNSALYKLAEATGVIGTGKPFLPKDIPLLLGKAAQFEVQLLINDKGYLNEKIKMAGVVPEGLPIPELDESHLYSFEFGVENKPEVIKNMRKSIINTVKAANNYENDIIKTQIESLENASAKAKEDSVSGVEAKPTEVQVSQPVQNSHLSDDDFDVDVPF